MKRLILMRHGDAPRAFGGDHERELSAIGTVEVEATAHHIKSTYKIDHIICSSAKRNRQTLDVLQQHIDATPVEFSDDIYRNDPTILKKLVSAISDDTDTIMLLGHNPSLLAFALDCDPDSYDEWQDQLSHGMNTAEVIVLECDGGSWEKFMSHGGKIKDIFMP